MIEASRFCNLELDQRICIQMCGIGIETESHFLCICLVHVTVINSPLVLCLLILTVTLVTISLISTESCNKSSNGGYGGAVVPVLYVLNIDVYICVSVHSGGPC